MTIGERAARAIKSRANRKELNVELKRLDIPKGTYDGWMNGKCDPSPYYLKQMALAGYDIFYILTGKENSHVSD